MAGLFQDSDLEESQRRRHEAEGFEAPGNSLDEEISCRGYSEDVVLSSGLRFCKLAKRRKASSVVARLMGLDDAMPRNSSQEMPKRNHHPQEAELERFKEFAAKQQREDDVTRQMEEKKRKVRATLDKVKLALSQGKFVESREFLEAMEFLQCNKDFIFQFLQQKPHVVFSKTDSLNGNSKPPRLKKKEKSQAGRDSSTTERGFSRRAFARLFIPTNSRKRNDPEKQQIDAIATLKESPVSPVLRPGGSRDLTSEEAKLRTGSCVSSRYLLPASPKALSKHESKGTDKKSGTRDVKDLLRRQSCEGVQSKLRNSKALEANPKPKTSNFTLTKSLSTGKRISMMRPDEDEMSDSVEISTPTLHPKPSPATFRAKLTKTTTKMNGWASAVKTPTRRAVESTTRTNSKNLNPKHSVNPKPASLTRCRSVPNMATLREREPCTTTGVAKTQNSSLKPARSSKPSDQRTLGCFSVGKNKGSKAGHEALEAVSASPCPSPALSLANSSTPRETKVRRNILESGRNSNGPEFLESPSGPHEFKDISNDLQGPPRIRLRRPNLDGSQKSLRTNELDSTKGRVLNQVDENDERVRDNEFGITRETHHAEVPHQSVQRPSNVERPLQTLNCKRAEDFALQTLNSKPAKDFAPQILNPKPTEGFAPQILHPKSAESFALQTLNSKPAEAFVLQTPNPKPSDDFAFVCNALVASGFHAHGGRNIMPPNIIRWHSATQPVSPHVLKRLGGCAHPRRALLDAINEVLIAKLELSAVKPDQCCFGLPIVGAPKSAVRGRRFVEEVWGEIQKRQFPVVVGAGCDEGYLHGLVAQDLVTTSSSWLSLRRDVDRVCLQVERAVWNDLMDELCSGLLSVN